MAPVHIPWGRFGSWKSPWCKGTFISLPQGKPQQPQCVNLDLSPCEQLGFVPAIYPTCQIFERKIIAFFILILASSINAEVSDWATVLCLLMLFHTFHSFMIIKKYPPKNMKNVLWDSAMGDSLPLDGLWYHLYTLPPGNQQTGENRILTAPF